MGSLASGGRPRFQLSQADDSMLHNRGDLLHFEGGHIRVPATLKVMMADNAIKVFSLSEARK